MRHHPTLDLLRMYQDAFQGICSLSGIFTAFAVAYEFVKTAQGFGMHAICSRAYKSQPPLPELTDRTAHPFDQFFMLLVVVMSWAILIPSAQVVTPLPTAATQSYLTKTRDVEQGCILWH